MLAAGFMHLVSLQFSQLSVIQDSILCMLLVVSLLAVL